MTPEEKVSMLAGTDNWHTRSIERLGIPALRVSDGTHGIRFVQADEPYQTLPATCFPTGVAMAATWNTELVNRVGAALAQEARARGCTIVLGPCVNIHRSPLGGRNFESFSEDPHLSARMAVAHIDGMQDQNVGASVKHFALNNSEFQRFTISSEAWERALREIYLPSFEAAVMEAGSWTVMCSYNRVNGIYASENKYLLTDILKDEWGFEGFVVSDWGAVHSTVAAANAGLDLEMPGPARFFGEALLSAVHKGEVSRELVDDKVRRILRVVLKSATSDKEGALPDGSAASEHRKLAREVASEAIVLLKNENSILPLGRADIKSIAIIGPNANEARIEGGGSSRVRPYYIVTPLEALRKRCGDSVKISYELGCRNNRFTPLLDSKHLIPGGMGEGRGLTGEYFANNSLSGEPVLTRLDNEFAFAWGFTMGISIPGLDIERDEFSIRWTGTFAAPQSGKYKFGLLTNGFGRVFIDNKLLVDKWSDVLTKGGAVTRGERVGEIGLEAGRSYGLKVEYCQNPDRQSVVRSIRLGCELPVAADSITRAMDIAARSDIALVFAGTSEEYESEGFDREDMELPGDQAKLIRTVAEANKNTVVVLNNGSPVSMEGWLDDVAGVVEAWFPGQECGNAIADVLFGEVSPSGKLPDTFPKRIEDNPAYLNYPGENGKVLYGEGIFVGYRYYDAKKIEPLYPFGHGLSYTSFEYRNLRVSSPDLIMGDRLEVTVDIKNTGEREGKEVVQLYVRDTESSLVRPPKELKGFKKVNLKPAETATVSFDLTIRDLSFYDPDRKKWLAEPGEFEVLVGSSSRDIRGQATFSLRAAPS